MQQALFNDLNTSLPMVAKKTELTEEIKQEFLTSAKTSIFRSGASAPMKVLLSKNLFSAGSSINYGKGKFNHDTDAIKGATGHCVGYDYVYLPDVEVLGNSYTNLYSGYVVNTLPPAARSFVWEQMSDSTKGVAFVAARTDKISGVASEDGVITSIGTFQKSYKKQELVMEALKFFPFAAEIKGKAGFSIVACSHKPLSENILKHSK